MGEIHKNLEEVQTEYKNEYSKTIMYFVIKKIIDLLGSIIGLILLSPILIITAIAIKLDSKGPVFFIQERVGKNEQVFDMYKFRSMVIDAEEKLYKLKDKNEMSGPMFKMKDDPRITKIGRFIRKTSIDELPQLFNVLKGEMSLVGPRPNLPREVIKFTDYQKNKFLAKPGLTCYWQVMGRNNIDFEDWIELDIKYIRKRNTWEDIKLIFKTVGVLFGDDNAS
ncbi:multidrug MFS transporter [Clostridium sporogenes]|jgi:exopolysaccharide biosynthesis polyprenyl glycosylphosphotransferase|uniref:Multidrug MFS transporter n=1 Tax=Clostridium sporogenes TaxID=1509 RepID=A0ABD6RV27_CLOSG|nr:exopolysaccharide biosynthesis polyprenyl glycosylphosphotransferase [Clostridium sporogenes]MBE6077742.1 sugar transferase [Clostridium lundense]EDU36148.1 bacterial sugar transferase [Clostridium sporogenes ATCC 15579]MCW6094147.1 exopolysaccharide biosynthesis polyprenyl glycosylphosphotransferase [Clostridium sporogenes]NFE66096.1 sugar transferase [Clostridium sporogenes]NFH32256.1 sugar transferase [Clostridium sporogenes]